MKLPNTRPNCPTWTHETTTLIIYERQPNQSLMRRFLQDTEKNEEIKPLGTNGRHCIDGPTNMRKNLWPLQKSLFDLFWWPFKTTSNNTNTCADLKNATRSYQLFFCLQTSHSRQLLQCNVLQIRRPLQTMEHDGPQFLSHSFSYDNILINFSLGNVISALAKQSEGQKVRKYMQW